MVDKVDVVVFAQNFGHPVADGPRESGVGLEPGGVKAEGERGPVGGVVALQVVLQQVLELLLGVDVGTGGDQGTTGQSFVETGVVTTIQLVDGKLPNLRKASNI